MAISIKSILNTGYGTGIGYGYTGSNGATGYTGSAAVNTVPVNSKSSAYTIALSDVGKYISITSGGVTVPPGVFSPGDVVSIYNNSSSNQTITASGVIMYLTGTSITGNRTLAQRGLATILCVGTNTFVIAGGGVT